jgi:hypothetical protein
MGHKSRVVHHLPRARQAHLETISLLLDQAACHSLRLGGSLDRAVWR